MFEKLYWEKAKDSFVWIEGKKYIDFTSSIFSQNFGHNNPYMIREVKKQLKKCSHAYGYNTKVKEEFIFRLQSVIGFDRVLLFSTGAEAIEAAMKIVIHSAFFPAGIKNSMHGRTLCSEHLSGKRFITNEIKNYDEIENISDTITNRGFFIEGYRGYNCKLISAEEIKKIKDLQKHNLIIFDEIQSGFYRTRRFFAYQSYNIFPDMVVVGKSLGGGFPISAICYDSSNKNINIDGLELTSTHAGQPIQMAAGLGILKYIQEKFDWNKYTRNISIIDHFFPDQFFGMVGAFHVEDEDKFYKYCLDRGLLVVPTGRNYIKIAPPVVIDEKTLFKGMEILKEAVYECK